MKYVKTILNTVLVLCLLIIIIVGPLLYFSFNAPFYKKHIEKTDFAELGKERAADLIGNVISYLNGRENLDSSFTSDEANHMEDVKGLFTFSRILLIIAIGILAAIIIAAYVTLRTFSILLKPLFFASIIVLATGILILLFLITDFNSLFLWFHEIFFPQGNFSFPVGSQLITIFPESFFQAMATNIFITVGIISLVLLFVSYYLLRKK